MNSNPKYVKSQESHASCPYFLRRFWRLQSFVALELNKKLKNGKRQSSNFLMLFVRKNKKIRFIGSSNVDHSFDESPWQTYTHCFTKKLKFAGKACLCVWPPRQTLLDKYILLVNFKNILCLTSTISNVFQAMFVYLVGALSHGLGTSAQLQSNKLSNNVPTSFK